MKNLHIDNSYNIWKMSDMRSIIERKCWNDYDSCNPKVALNRTYRSMYIEWWLHNIGYYITKPFCFIEKIHAVNLRCRDIDLEEWV